MGGGSHNIQSSRSSADYGQNVFGPQSGALGNLYGDARQLFGNQDFSGLNDAGRWGGDYGRMIAEGAMPGYQNQLGGGFQANPGLMRAIQESMSGPSSMGQMYNSIVGGEGNTYIDPMVDAMKSGMQTDYDRNFNPSLDMAAAAAGQSGSSRHGIESALGKSELGRNMSNAESMLRGSAYDTDLNMKLDIARQADLGRGQAQDRGIDLLRMQNQNQQGALAGGQGMQGMGNAPMNIQTQLNQIPWQNLLQYAQAIGAPTVLGSGSQRGNSKGNAGSVSVMQ